MIIFSSFIAISCFIYTFYRILHDGELSTHIKRLAPGYFLVAVMIYLLEFVVRMIIFSLLLGSVIQFYRAKRVQKNLPQYDDLMGR